MLRFILLLVISSAVFFPGFSGGFLYWDDSTHIINNPALVSGDWLKFWRESYYALYIPVIYSLWTMVYALSSAPIAFHILNVVLHSLNGWMIHRLLKLSLPETPEGVGQGRGVIWLATLAYMFHPLQTESVVWISGGRDLVSTAFGLAAVLTLWERTSWRSYMMATALFILGLLSKATLAPLPVALLVLKEFRSTIWSVDRDGSLRWASKGRIRLSVLATWVVAAIGVLIVNKMVQQENTEAMLNVPSLPERFLIMADILGFYIQKIVLPFPLAPDYGRIPELVLAGQWYVWTAAIFLVALTAVILARIFGQVKFFEGWIFFGFILSPVLGLIPFMAQAQSSVADRYVYLAWFGPVMGVAAIATRFPKLKIGLAILVSIWMGLSFSHSRMWKDSDTFFTAMLDYNPDSFVGHTTIGVVKFQAGRLDLAEKHFREAHRIQPMLVSPVGNLAVLYWEQRRFDRIVAELEPLFQNPEFIKANLTTKPSLSRMGRIVARVQKIQSRVGDAHRSWCQAFALDPQNQDGVQEFLAVQQATGLSCERN